MFTFEQILLGTSVLLLLGVLASKLSDRLGIPALLLFLVLGMLAGSEGPGGIPFDDPWLAQSMGVVALAFILFSGGLHTDWQSVSPVVWEGLTLSTVGVLLTAALVAWFARIALGLAWLEGLLLGSIVASTDAAAVFSVLRSKNLSLKGKVQPLLELESGSNDPMAVFLTLGLTKLLERSEATPAYMIPMFALQMTLGAVLGYGIGKGATILLNRVKIQTEGLYPVITVAMVLLTYAAAASLGGNGFLAVYLAGMVMGNANVIHKRSLLRFHDGLAWLMQIAMFLTLGLLVFPSRLLPIAVAGMLVSLFLMFVARPASVFLSLAWVRMSLRQKVLVSWVGLRGAVPIILATFPLLAGIAKADAFFNIVFFIVLTSVLLQGTSIRVVARWLALQSHLPARRQYPIEFWPATPTRADVVELAVPNGSRVAGKQIVDLGMPANALIILISRGDDFLVPRGSTTVEAGDTMLVLAEKDDLAELRRLVSWEAAEVHE